MLLGRDLPCPHSWPLLSPSDKSSLHHRFQTHRQTFPKENFKSLREELTVSHCTFPIEVGAGAYGLEVKDTGQSESVPFTV